jgi:hypothetical protein
MAFRKNLPARFHFNKDQTPLGDLLIPTRGFTAALSVFGAHLLESPWMMKIGRNTMGAHCFGRCAERLRGEPRLSGTGLNLVFVNIISMSSVFCSSNLRLSLIAHVVFRK